MANATRSAKSSSEWTNNELIAYNITVSNVPPAEFFPTPNPPLDGIDSAILNSPPERGAIDFNLSQDVASYLGHLHLAIRGDQGCFINDFICETMKLVGFDEEHGTVLLTGFLMPLIICGDSDCIAKTGACVFHRPTFVLLVSALDTPESDARAQVIARSIAAFQYNNRERRLMGFDPLDVMTIPCISMSGTRPTFYLVPVTKELSKAVIIGQYPPSRTQVLQCVTTSTSGLDCPMDSVEDTEYRKLVLKRFIAFKALARIHWARVFEGL